MAIAGDNKPALCIVPVDGGQWYRVTHQSTRLSSVLATVEHAEALLRSGVQVWVAAADRAALEKALGRSVRSLRPEETDNAAVTPATR